MKKRKLFIFLLFLVMLVSCGTDVEQPSDEQTPTLEVPKVEYTFSTYQNAMIPLTKSGQEYWSEIADPSVVKGDDGLFYIFSTIRRAFVSSDMCNWDLLTDSIIDRPTWADGEKYGKPDVWAPDVIKVKDKWIYYYSLAAWDMPSAGIGYAVADNVAGPYTDMGLLFNEDDIEMNGLIDPQPIIDDGHVYMLVGSFHGNYLVELTDDGMGLLGGASYQNENKVLVAGIPLDYFNNSYYEGGYIIKKDEYYYFFGSAGSCCEGKSSSYRVYVGKSSSITGPYLAPDGKDLASNNMGSTIGKLVLWCPPSGSKTTAGPGHNSIIVDDANDYWIVYHGYCDADNFKTRHLFMDKLSWDDEGYPYVSYSYTNDDGKLITSNIKPSYQIELDGPRFIVK